MKRHILIIDDNNVRPCKSCYAFRRTVKSSYEVYRPTETELPQNLDRFTHIVLTGGPGTLLDEESIGYLRIKRLIKNAMRDKIPLLGICLGHELIIAAQAGISLIQRQSGQEIGWVHIRRTGESRLLEGLPEVFSSFASHFNHLKHLPKDFHTIASSDRCKIAGYEHNALPVFGLQFHPEKNPRNTLVTVLRHLHQRVAKKAFIHPYSARSNYNPGVAHQIFHNFYSSKRG